MGRCTVMGVNTSLQGLAEGVRDKSSLYQDPQKLWIPANWGAQVRSILKAQGYRGGPWLFKSPLLTQQWNLWHYAFPEARWVIVRRRTGDIINSCCKTAYMATMKDARNLQKIGVEKEEDGWKWWVHQYEQSWVAMIEAGLNCKVVWPERMVTGDFQQMYETLEWLGLKWDFSFVSKVERMLHKVKEA